MCLLGLRGGIWTHGLVFELSLPIIHVCPPFALGRIEHERRHAVDSALRQIRDLARHSATVDTTAIGAYLLSCGHDFDELGRYRLMAVVVESRSLGDRKDICDCLLDFALRRGSRLVSGRCDQEADLRRFLSVGRFAHSDRARDDSDLRERKDEQDTENKAQLTR